MKKWIVFLAGLLLFGGVVFFPSCDEEQPTTGILVIQVVDSNGFAIPEEQVFRDVVVITPLNRIKVKSLKIVRIENSVKKVIFALYIKEIEEKDYTDLKNIMIYFEKFSKNEK